MSNFLSSPIHLVCIDRSVEDPAMLAKGVRPGAQVVFLEPERDGIEQITQILKSSGAIASLHLVAHGLPASIGLGSSLLNLETLESYAKQLSSWSEYLSGASLLIYSCQVASGEAGKYFLSRIAALTQAHIAAATTRVGNSQKGGSWWLDYQIGQVISDLIFSPRVQNAYTGVFANYSESSSGDISDNPSAPLFLQLGNGVNTLEATSSAGDIEYVTVNIPEGFQLDSITLASYVSSDDVAFAAVQRGSTFTEFGLPSEIDVENLLGWSHINSGQVGTNVLDNIGRGSGAIGFTGALPSGNYTFWLQQTGEPSTVTYQFNVTPVSTVLPVVSFSASPTTLVEEDRTLLTLTFSLNVPPPAAGLTVTIDSPLARALAELDVLAAQFNGATLVGVNADSSGLTLRLTSQTATIQLPVFDDALDEGGTESISFALQPSSDYTINPAAASVTLIINDSDTPPQLPVVSFSASPTTLVESEGTVLVLSFSLDQAPPAGGITVYLDSETVDALREFDVSNLEFTGGEFPEPNTDASGFSFTITQQTATITLPVLEDGEVEGVETLTLTLQTGDGYTIEPDSKTTTLTLNDEDTMTLPIVSFAAIPANISEETPNAEVIWQWTVTGDFPEEGILVNLDTLGENDIITFTEQFAGDRQVDFVNSEIVNFDPATGRLQILLRTPNNSSFVLPIANDVIEEGAQTFDFRLAAGEGYTLNPDQNATLLTISDDNGGPGVGPTVGISVNKTELTEAGDELTVTFTVNGEIPEGGTTVLVSSPNFTAVADFDVAGIDYATDITGTDGQPLEGNASSFLINITEPTATITIKTFDDNIDEGIEELPFNLINGEEYEVDPNANGFTLNIDDQVDQLNRPTVSLQTIAGSFDPSDNILASELVRSLEEGASLLTFVFHVEGEIPEGGLIVDVEGTIDLDDYFTGLARPPFSPGGQILEAIYALENPESAIGFKFRIDQPNAIFSFRLNNDEEASGIVETTYSLGALETYSIDPQAGSSTVIFYDTLANVPAPTITPEVSFSFSETNLIESAGTLTTVSFTLSEAPPPEGVLVYLASPSRFLGEFDIFNAQVEGGVFPAPNFLSSGFFFKITEQEASITLPIFADGETEGIESVTLSLQEAPGYTIAAASSPVILTLKDTPESQIQVSLTGTPSLLVESNGTVSAHTFTLSAPPPEGGITVTVNTPDLKEFDYLSATVTGGTITALRENGFDLKITEQIAIVDLPVDDDGLLGGLQSATFTLVEGTGYQVSPTANTNTFSIIDNPSQTPPPSTINEPNDTIALAVDTRLGELYPAASFNSSIDYVNNNRYPVEGGFLYVDATEDVDLYKVDLKAGDVLRLDIDAQQTGSTLNSVLRIFNANGEALVQSDNNPAPGEFFLSRNDSYLEFSAPADGTYYVGVSSNPNGEFTTANNPYEPNVPASGTGRSRGTYTLNASINQENGAEPTSPEASTGTGPVISLQTVEGTFDPSDNILAPALVRSLEEGASILNLIVTAQGEIPEEGVDVYLSSDGLLGDYFPVNNLPFAPGAQVLGAFYNEEGQASGLVVKVFSPNTLISLRLLNSDAPVGKETVTFTLEEAQGYQVDGASESAEVTFYDTLADVPAPSTTPAVSFTMDTTTLLESEGTLTTLTFSLSEAPPAEGTLVYLAAPQQFLGDFDVLNATVSGGVFPAPNFSSSGFFFKILEQEASISLSVFPDGDTEGLESYTLSLREAPGYTIAPEAEPITFTIADTTDSLLQVSLTRSPATLIEAAQTVSVHTFTLSAPPPEGGITVSVNAPNLSEFNLDGISVTGGTIAAVRADGFDLTITERIARINLPVANDGSAEGSEIAVFTLLGGDGYQISPTANSASFTILDAATPTEQESNDTIAQAQVIPLSATQTSFTLNGSIGATGNRANLVDASEDIDLYSVSLQAGDTLEIDVDSVAYTITGSTVSQRLDSELRLFNAAGVQLAANFDGYAPDELFVANRDPYLEFTATEAGTYYVGVAQWQNRVYNPLTAENSSGRIDINAGRNTGAYSLNLNLVSDFAALPVVGVTATPLIVSEAVEDPLLTFSFNVSGNFPEDGLVITVGGDVLTLFDPERRLTDDNRPFVFEPQGGIELVALRPDVGGYDLRLTKPIASVGIPIFDDIIEEPDETFTFNLVESEDYMIAPSSDTATVTFTDGIPLGVGPTVSFSLSKTDLVEGEEFTVNFEVDGEIPAGGIPIFVDGAALSLSEFNIFGEDGIDPETDLVGLAGFPEPDNDAGGFFVTILENQASITLSVFDDEPNEGVETFSFVLANGEQYEVDPSAGEVTLTINDLPFFTGTTGDDEFNVRVSPPGFNGSNDLVFAGEGDDLIDTSIGNGNNRLYGQSGNDTFFLGSGDKAFGGSGEDIFYFLGKDSLISGGMDADQFWVAQAEYPESLNTITDFELGTDIIGIGGLGISFSDLTITPDNGNALIAHNEQELVKLLGVNASSLTASSFVFA